MRSPMIPLHALMNGFRTLIKGQQLNVSYNIELY